MTSARQGSAGRRTERSKAYARHRVAYWRVAVTAAPFGAIVALACGVTIDAEATSAHTLEVIRTASWTMTAVATLWFGIIATAGRLPRTESAFEWRMLGEPDSRMVYAANAQSVMCAAVTLTVVVAMVR